MHIYEKPWKNLEDMSQADLLQLIQTSPVMSLPELMTIMYRAANEALTSARPDEFIGLPTIQAIQYKAAVAAFEAKKQAQAA